MTDVAKAGGDNILCARFFAEKLKRVI